MKLRSSSRQPTVSCSAAGLTMTEYTGVVWSINPGGGDAVDEKSRAA